MALMTWLLLTKTLLMHPFYVSMTDINYSSKTRTLQVSVRIFTDDFEKTLRQSCNCKVDLSAANNKAMADLAATYITRHLQIVVDGKMQVLTYIGYQPEDESTWNYFEIKNIPAPRKLELKNTLLHDYRQEQVNMLHITAGGKDQSDKLDFPESYYSISF